MEQLQSALKQLDAMHTKLGETATRLHPKQTQDCRQAADYAACWQALEQLQSALKQLDAMHTKLWEAPFLQLLQHPEAELEGKQGAHVSKQSRRSPVSCLSLSLLTRCQ